MEDSKDGKPRRRRHSARIGGFSQSAFAGSAMSPDVDQAGKRREADARRNDPKNDEQLKE